MTDYKNPPQEYKQPVQESKPIAEKMEKKGMALQDSNVDKTKSLAPSQSPVVGKSAEIER